MQPWEGPSALAVPGCPWVSLCQGRAQQCHQRNRQGQFPGIPPAHQGISSVCSARALSRDAVESPSLGTPQNNPATVLRSGLVLSREVAPDAPLWSLPLLILGRIRRGSSLLSPCTTAWGTRGPWAPHRCFSWSASSASAAQTTGPGRGAALWVPGSAHSCPRGPHALLPTWGSLVSRMCHPQCLLSALCLVPRWLK